MSERLVALFRTSRPLRFLIVGGFNTAFSYLVYAGLIALTLPFWLANLGALLCGIVVSFILQGRIVFGNSDPRRFGRFVMSWLVIYVIQTGLIGLLVRSGFGPLVAGLIVLPGAAIASYLVQRAVVFRVATGKKGIRA